MARSPAIDPVRAPLYSKFPFLGALLGLLARMNESSAIALLEGRVDELVRAMERLRDENYLLREKQTALLQERDMLLEKTELARGRVEAMIQRIKTLEHG